MPKIESTVMVDASSIRAQAEKIRDVVQRVIDACDTEAPITPYARNKITGGSLAGDAAALAVMIIMHELGR